MTKRIATVLILLATLIQGAATAGQDSDKLIRTAIGEILPGVPISEITPSPLEGVSEVVIGGKLFYVSNDGKYLMQGSLIELATRTNLSEKRLDGIRLAAMKELKETEMIVFPAKEQRHVITVFTDIDCGYCRKLHAEIDQYNALGITVRYLMYPRSGPNSPSFNKAVSVWCNEDRQQALTRAKAGETLAQVTCDNPVASNYSLGERMGVRGTPAILLENGELLPGYLPAAKLASELKKRG